MGDARKLTPSLQNGFKAINGGSKIATAAPSVDYQYQATTTNDVTSPTGPADVVRSAIPFIAFLTIYGLNKYIRILPRASDSQCITLHNVSALERRLFGGIEPHVIIAAASNPVLDFLSAAPYLIHYLIPVAFPVFLWFTAGPTRRCDRIARFYWLLGWTMWAHFLIWFLFPTAPPWVADNMANYHRQNATATPPPLHLQPREGCAFARIDKMTGVPLFSTIFSGNPIPFASFPSGHVAWPTCALLTQMFSGCSRRRRALLAVYVMWVAWATMYSCHHYLSDVIAAVLTVVVVHRIIEYFQCHGSICIGRRRDLRGDAVNGGCLLSVV